MHLEYGSYRRMKQSHGTQRPHFTKPYYPTNLLKDSGEVRGKELLSHCSPMTIIVLLPFYVMHFMCWIKKKEIQDNKILTTQVMFY